MKVPVFYTEAPTQAVAYATQVLQTHGIVFSPKPTKAVTHLLLGVPSFLPDSISLDTLLNALSADAVLIGGNLKQIALPEHRKLDLLINQHYLAKNAAITAHCAVQVALEHYPGILECCKVLVIGWGRIGKCLARLLRSMDADVRIVARSSADRAMASSLGYEVAGISQISDALQDRRIIFNTVPAPVLEKNIADRFCKDHIKIDLASTRGIEGEDVIWARGLPGKLAPEASGALIAKTIMDDICWKGEVI